MHCNENVLYNDHITLQQCNIWDSTNRHEKLICVAEELFK